MSTRAGTTMTEGDQQVVSDERLERIARLRERRTRGSAADVTGSGPSSIQSDSTVQSDSTIRSDGASTPATSAPRRRRGHPARDSRIVAAGLGAAAMFGIVTLLGLNTPTTKADIPDQGTSPSSGLAAARLAEPAVAPPVKVVIHRVEPTTNLTDTTAATADPALRTGPIELTANPVVRTVTVAAPATSGTRAVAAAPAPQPAPTATTSGSS